MMFIRTCDNCDHNYYSGKWDKAHCVKCARQDGKKGWAPKQIKGGELKGGRTGDSTVTVQC